MIRDQLRVWWSQWENNITVLLSMYCWCEWKCKYKKILASGEMFYMLGLGNCFKLRCMWLIDDQANVFESHFLNTAVQIKQVVEPKLNQTKLFKQIWSFILSDFFCFFSSNATTAWKPSKETFTPLLCSKYQSRQELCLSFSLVKNKQNKASALHGIYVLWAK